MAFFLFDVQFILFLFCAMNRWVLSLVPAPLTTSLVSTLLTTFAYITRSLGGKGGYGGGARVGWVGLRQGLIRTCCPMACTPFGATQWRSATRGCPVARPTGLLAAPGPCGGTRGREMPPSRYVWRRCGQGTGGHWRGGGGGGLSWRRSALGPAGGGYLDLLVPPR